MARDVAEVARLLVPVEVAHRRPDRSIGARAGPATRPAQRAVPRPRASRAAPRRYLRGLAPALAAAHPGPRLTVVTTRSGAAALRARRLGRDWAVVRALPCEEGQRGRRQLAEQVLLPALARRVGRRRPALASPRVAPIRVPGVAHVDHAPRRDVLPPAHLRRGDDVRHAPGRRAGGPPRRRAHRGDGRRARRDLRRARARPGRASRSSPTAPTPGRRVAPAPAQAECASATACGGAPRRALRRGQAPAQEPGAARARRAAARRRRRRRPRRPPRALRRRAARRSRPRSGSTAASCFADYVPDADLEALWALAGCAAFPTRAEGFGLPVLDALRRGVPVACVGPPGAARGRRATCRGGSTPTTRPARRRRSPPRSTTRATWPPPARPGRRASRGRPPRRAPGPPTSARCAADVRVGLNLVFLVPGETGGMETYARELMPAPGRAATTSTA